MTNSFAETVVLIHLIGGPEEFRSMEIIIGTVSDAIVFDLAISFLSEPSLYMNLPYNNCGLPACCTVDEVFRHGLSYKAGLFRSIYSLPIAKIFAFCRILACHSLRLERT